MKVKIAFTDMETGKTLYEIEKDSWLDIEFMMRTLTSLFGEMKKT